jgi:phthalate 4,5-cis-dihydrodiol dehydrogenase
MLGRRPWTPASSSLASARSNMKTNRKLRVGIVGLGRAFTVMLPTFMQHEGIKVVAGTDPIAAARRQFEQDFAARAYASIEELCADPEVEAVYIATPHQFHAIHVEIAASSEKHILVEKPMALTIGDCTRMIEAARRAGVFLVVGPSHSFDTPILHARKMIESGMYGDVRMIHSFYFTDFLYRPRRPEELVTAQGGGVVHSQAAHQMDIVRMLGGGLVRTVQAHTGAWDASRPTEGAYTALLGFEGGAFASATYSGYAHYDSNVLLGNISEGGELKDPGNYGAARKRLRAAKSAAEEAALKAARNYGGSLYQPPAPVTARAHQHFGHIVICCERADLHPAPTGIEIFADEEKRFEALPSPPLPRREVIDELIAAALGGIPPVHDGEWGRATTETCLAILEAARSRSTIHLEHQVKIRSIASATN